MNTKTIIGIIAGIAIIVGGTVWIMKAPASPEQPVATAPVTAPDTASTAAATPATVPAPTATPAPAVKSGIISTKTVNGMKIEVTKEGTGPAITNGQTAVMLYTGKLPDGSVFDSTAKRNNDPFSFSLGAGQVIKGWDQGILGMKVGEKRTLTIPAELGYGANGYPPVIPQNATLIFDVELVGIK
jgi:FKBP-type peptidyl-prolyl cis-trans isomerase